MAEVESLERNAKDREWREKSTVEDVLEELRAKNLINEELKEKLDFYSDLPVHLLTKQDQEYTKDQKEFVLTLHLYGPKAYTYLRESLHLNLPHPHTLRRWMSSVDAKPGLNKMMLDMLRKKQEEDPTKYGRVCLMLDSMSIRSHVQYDPHTQSMSGYVDMGDGVNETDEATEALVFMVVGLQGHWKAPVAYYLTQSLSPVTQKVLLVHALEGLHEAGIKVVCVTMDGHASNINMCNQLGCQIKLSSTEPLQTFFLHPATGERVYVMLDARHMLKLTRNMLQAYSPIISSTGQIDWRFIVQLNNLQVKEGLHAAHKDTDKHVNFDSQKLKVSLAAQTLSHSVAVALRSLRDRGYSQFQLCEATAEFIELMDRLFDTMHSRNPRAEGFKAPLSTLNWSERVGFLLRGRNYLMALMMKDGTPLHCHKMRYLSVMGFIINIDTLIYMIPEQLQTQRYICTYRFSRDHLELLFKSFRASGGWNNNPSSGQFQAVFRRLMLSCGVSPGRTGNAAAVNDAVFLSAVDLSSAPATEESDDLPSLFTNIPALVSDHNYLPTCFGGLVDDALTYMSGFVVRRVLRTLACGVCRGSLVTDAAAASTDHSFHLLTLRNRGGLLIPSEGTVKVLTSAERFIRQSEPGQNMSVFSLNRLVRADVGSQDVFHLKGHIEDTQYGIENHHFGLMSVVVSVFHKLRYDHTAKMRTLQIGSSRKRLCKTILNQDF